MSEEKLRAALQAAHTKLNHLVWQIDYWRRYEISKDYWQFADFLAPIVNEIGHALNPSSEAPPPPPQELSDEALRSKELAVVAHMKNSWDDGCMCDPCVAIREIVAASGHAQPPQGQDFLQFAKEFQSKLTAEATTEPSKMWWASIKFPEFLASALASQSGVSPVAPLCKHCKSPIELVSGEWRHKGPINKYFAQTFCDKYGYTTQLEPVAQKEPQVAAREAYLDAARIAVLEGRVHGWELAADHIRCAIQDRASALSPEPTPDKEPK